MRSPHRGEYRHSLAIQEYFQELEHLVGRKTERNRKVSLRSLQSPPDLETKDGGVADVINGKGN